MTPSEVAGLLETSGQSFARLLETLPPSVASWHPANGEWCVKECAGHIIEAEKLGFAGRIRAIIEGEEPQLKSWDQAEVERARHDCERDQNELAGELERVRKESL